MGSMLFLSRPGDDKFEGSRRGDEKPQGSCCAWMARTSFRGGRGTGAAAQPPSANREWLPPGTRPSQATGTDTKLTRRSKSRRLVAPEEMVLKRCLPSARTHKERVLPASSALMTWEGVRVRKMRYRTKSTSERALGL